jgi:hypothetical protein
MYSLYHDRLKDGQIVYVQSQNQLYVTSKFVAFETPGYAGFDDSASFATFQFPSSGGTDISALNTFTGSIQSQVNGLNSVTSSYALKTDISGAFTSLSASIASRFDTLGGIGGIFSLTGSFYSTTNNVQITGSLSVSSGSFEGLKVDSVGRTIIGDSSNLNLEAIEGGIIYSGSSFYFGL